MSGCVAALYRYPVKGFSPELLETVLLTPGAGFPNDRVYAVEDGPSGFDADAPAHIPKMRFTVLAKIPDVARIRTRYNEANAGLRAEAPGRPPFESSLRDEAGRNAFATWLAEALDQQFTGPLRVIGAPGGHRFFDHPQGAVSLINLESVRDLEAQLGRAIDPLRFRANIYIEGWPAWSELETVDRVVEIGSVRARAFKPIQRCLATHVDPRTGVRDIEMVEELRSRYGHVLCGVYLQIEAGGEAGVGYPVRLAP
ncbi:MAG: MOSC domain-containing protein [Proteobacteria bacterium]|nr:MOSC domain-containing protein [Pseudomonadota bacterium]